MSETKKAKPFTRAELAARCEALESALRRVVRAFGYRCDGESDYDDGTEACGVVVARTTMWTLPVHLCEKHAELRRASHRKAESKGCGKQPDVVPFSEDGAILEARTILGAQKGPT